MNDTTYDGWTNRSTWNVALWFSNDQGLYHRAIDFAKENYQQGEDEEQFTEDFVREIWPDGVTPDGDSLDDVNWTEIVRSFREDADMPEVDPETRDLLDIVDEISEALMESEDTEQMQRVAEIATDVLGKGLVTYNEDTEMFEYDATNEDGEEEPEDEQPEEDEEEQYESFRSSCYRFCVLNQGHVGKCVDDKGNEIG